MVTQASQRHTQDNVVLIAFTCVYNGLSLLKNPRHDIAHNILKTYLSVLVRTTTIQTKFYMLLFSC